MSLHTSYYQRRPGAAEPLSSSYGATQTRLPVISHATVPQRNRDPSGRLATSAEPRKSTVQVPYRDEGEQRNTFTHTIPARNAKTEERPSGLPRASSSLSSSSQERPSTSRFIPRLAIATQSHTASNTAPKTPGGPEKDRPRNVLRRKAPSVSKQPLQRQVKSEASKPDDKTLHGSKAPMSLPGGYRDPFPGSLLGIPLPSTSVSSSYMPTVNPQSRLDGPKTSRIPEFAGLTNVVPKQQPSQQMQTIVSASSPSTRYSESPGPWSSSASTPTSMSSYSPGIVQSSKIGSLRQRQISPTRTRPPVTRRKGTTTPLPDTDKDATRGLPALRESVTSLSSGFTVKEERPGRGVVEKKKQKKRLSPPPPSPPPRKSSMKFMSPKRGTYSDKTEELEPPLRGVQKVLEPQGPLKEHIMSGAIAVEAMSDSRPTRPTREGTPNLDVAPSPVIQSNLSPLKVIGHLRRISGDRQALNQTGQPTAKNPSALPAKELFQAQSTSRNPLRYATPSPRTLHTQIQPFPTIKGPSSHGEPSQSHRKQTSNDSKDSASGSTKLSTRFGFFGKRSRTPQETSDEQSDKASRKGPAAGTGHEGYGKYAQRGRRTSIGSSGTVSRGRSTSTTNSAAGSTSRKGSVNSREDSDMEDFVAQRLEPIVITGGGQVRSRRDSYSTTDHGSMGSTPSVDSTAQLEQHLRPTIDSGYKSSSQSSVHVRPYHGAGTVFASIPRTTSPEGIEENFVPTLAARRSLHRSQHFDKEALRLPTPINTSLLGSPPSLDSYDTSHSSLPQTDTTLPPTDDMFARQEVKSGKKPEKKGKSTRWNFFQRNQGNEHRAPTSELEPLNVTEMPATISHVPAWRPVAHYAMLDPEQDESDSLEDILQRVEESPQKDFGIDRTDLVPLGLGLRRQHGQSILLPSPPNFPAEFAPDPRPSSPKVFLHREHAPHKPNETLSPEKGRPKRLAEVGRIPRVISRRDRQHTPPAKSFSRPFVRTSMEMAPPLPPAFAEIHEAGRPSLGIQTDVLPSRPFYGDDSGKPASAPVPTHEVLDPLAYGEFLVFPPRKNSGFSASSSSGGVPSYATSNPAPGEPMVKTAEDEVWNEYDDLIDHVMSPSPPKTSPRTAQSATSSHGDPFRYAAVASESLQAETGSNRKDSIVIGYSSPAQTQSVMLPASDLSVRSSDSVRLRRSRILSALGSTVPPDTPMSIGDFYAGYEERNRSSANLHNRESKVSSAARTSYQSTVARPPSVASTSLVESSRQRNTVLLNIAERDRNVPIAQSNLRFGALMTSRWLSFGRVLFSPAHSTIKENRHDRILVLDGLGNDDWSFYCALTYPTASIYSLSAMPAPNTSRRNSASAWQAPSNHRTIHHPDISQPFPFPKGFFAACVVRFPAATSEAALRSAVSECKRTLRPGGYIEISILDLDMMNMGNRTRRAVRMLKVRMSVADPDVSLKPASDNIQSILGRKGFENLNRCVVGVPVAGRVIGSRDSNSSTSRSSAAEVPSSSGGVSSSTPATTASSASRHRRHSALDDEEKNFSLSDVMSDHSPASDEHITKMVARVGRWWYTRCYEWAVLPDGDLERSIWADRKVLRECEQRGSGFKLLIAYAQKPVESRRRTVSEPGQFAPVIADF